MFDHLPGTGFWLTVLVFAALGFCAAIAGVIYAVIWAVHHIRIQ
jgi:hypothetical protein